MQRAAVALVLVLMLVAGCGGTGGVASTALPAATVEPTVPPATATSVPPTATPLPTATPVPPTKTPLPTATPVPTPAYHDPVVLAEIAGTGNQVTDNYALPPCSKAVFYWTVLPSDYGSAALIVRLYNADTGNDTAIINEFDSDVAAAVGLTGAVLQALKGGNYYFATENASGDWNLRIECQDGVAPQASGTLLVAGRGISVTANFELPKCQKSIFAWSASPSKYGSAAIIVYLVKVGAEVKAANLVNEFAADRTEPLTGEAVQALSGGLYYLTITNTGGRDWQVTWQCRD